VVKLFLQLKPAMVMALLTDLVLILNLVLQ
jgi:hypothetical protein